MKALDRKLLRDLWSLKGQAFAITLVVITGVSTFVMFISTMDSLNLSREKYYREYNFSDVFVNLKRAPESLKEQMKEIPGVNLVETRVSAEVKLDIPGFPEPVIGKLVSVPDNGKPFLNKLSIQGGRLPDPSKDNEAVISETFAKAHGFSIGETFGAIINGRWKTLCIVGVALSPEFVLQMRPDAVSPDFKRYGILWMARGAMSRAYDMEGAFNDAALSISPQANIEDVITRLDILLDRYGSTGAYGRKDQLSHRILSDEFRQLKRSAEIFPTIFILVSAFLLNVVISRIVGTQREQIAALKAFGYSNLQVGVHFVKLVVLITLAGVAVGIGLGIWMGIGLGNVYMTVYRFPDLLYRLRPIVAGGAAAISLSSALLGTLHAVWRAAKEPPAEALRPEPPARYRVSLIERAGLGRYITQPTKIIVRNIERKPLRSLFTVIGIGMACATMVTSGFFSDAVKYIVNVQFVLSQREDLSVSFIEPTSGRAVYDLMGVRGISYAEAYRVVPVRFRNGNRTYKSVIYGVDNDSHLRRILDVNLERVSLPPEGIILTEYFKEVLGVREGDLLTVEVLEGSKPVREVPVAGFVNQYIGLMGYMDRTAVNRMMREGSSISGAYLVVDPELKDSLYRELIDMPRVAGTVVRKDEVRNFYEVQARALLFFTFVAMLMSGCIAFGVVYNSMRVALSERGRELSSLRVLGYTRGEISYILLGELALLTLAAIPVGFAAGRILSAYIAHALSSDLFRVPVVIELQTYSLAAAVVLASALCSALVVRRMLDRLNLVEVLKTKE
jgi:putative ABC transport system permease protein